MAFVTLRTFESSVEAHLLRSRLEHEGIRCSIFDEHIVSQIPTYFLLMGGIKLGVAEADYNKALKFVEELERSPITDDDDQIIRCPVCASTALYSGFKSMRGVKGFLSLMVSLIFGVIPLYFKTVFKCKQCGAEFRPPVPDTPGLKIAEASNRQVQKKS